MYNYFNSNYFMTNYISSIQSQIPMVQFYAKLFGSHEALLRFGVPGASQATSRSFKKKKRRHEIDEISGELSDEPIAFACDLIRIDLGPYGSGFVDVNRADGRIACNHSDNDTIARFDPKTLPNTNEVSLQSVAHWTHWGEYVPPYAVAK
jgi:hypothetical protein